MSEVSSLKGEPLSNRLANVSTRNSLVTNAHYSPLSNASYSIDMLRYRLICDKSLSQSVINSLDLQMMTDYVDTWTSTKLGTYRFLYVYHFDEFVITVGWGLWTPHGCDLTQGFLESNPNKIADHIRDFLDYLDDKHVKCDVIRYDLAIDFFQPRKNFSVLKDRRGYKYINQGGAVTEYLGSRSRPGFFKLYDKTVESDLTFDLTRCELTCDYEWTAEQVLSHLPIVYDLTLSPQTANSYDFAFISSLQQVGLLGGCIDNVLSMLKGTRKVYTKVKRLLAQCVSLHFDLATIDLIKKDVDNWNTLDIY